MLTLIIEQCAQNLNSTVSCFVVAMEKSLSFIKRICQSQHGEKHGTLMRRETPAVAKYSSSRSKEIEQSMSALCSISPYCSVAFTCAQQHPGTPY